MRFQLPQFIETEVKLIGPLTLKQFLWVGGGAGLIFILFYATQGLFFLVLALPIAAITLGLAFAKVDGTPLITYVSNALSYILSPKKYVFKSKDEDNLNIPSSNPNV